MGGLVLMVTPEKPFEALFNIQIIKIMTVGSKILMIDECLFFYDIEKD